MKGIEEGPRRIDEASASFRRHALNQRSAGACVTSPTSDRAMAIPHRDASIDASPMPNVFSLPLLATSATASRPNPSPPARALSLSLRDSPTASRPRRRTRTSTARRRRDRHDVSPLLLLLLAARRWSRRRRRRRESRQHPRVSLGKVDGLAAGTARRSRVSRRRTRSPFVIVPAWQLRSLDSIARTVSRAICRWREVLDGPLVVCRCPGGVNEGDGSGTIRDATG